MKHEQQQPLPWRRGLLWLCLLGPLFFLSYGLANGLAAARGVETSLAYGWEAEWIPFWPWTIVPYWSIDLLYGLSFLCLRSKRAVDVHALRLLTAQLLAVGCFILFPLRFSLQRPVTEGFFGQWFAALELFDQPFNQAPSLHIALLVLIWLPFARCTANSWLRWLVHGWALLIALSVVTTWQHHLFDVPTGLALGLLCVWLWPQQGRAPWRKGQDAGHWRLAGFYGAGALAALMLACLYWQSAWLSGWLALSLALVAWNYAHAGAAGFQKQEGRLSLAAWWLFLPYRLGARLNVWCWTRQQPAAVQITEQVWLGSMQPRRAWLAARFDGYCDLTAEFHVPAGDGLYAGHAWLDLCPPAAGQMLAAARSIEQLRQQLQADGRLLVACALGYSRSAAAVACWLCLTGQCPDAEAALQRLQDRGRRVVLSTALRQQLDAAVHHIRLEQGDG